MVRGGRAKRGRGEGLAEIGRRKKGRIRREKEKEVRQVKDKIE